MANWSTGQLPTSADVVCVAGDGVSAVLDTGTATIGSIEVGLGASLTVVNATLELAGPGESTFAHLLVDSGTLGGVGSRTVTGLLDLRRGVLTGSATTAVGPGAELRIGAGAGGSLALAGGHVLRIEEGALATWGPTAVEITLEAPGSLVNAGTFEITTDARVRGAGTLVNTGTLTKRSHGLTGIDAPFDNDGTLAVEAGVLDITTDGGLGSDGAITLAERTSLRTFGNVTLGAAASVTGAGDVQVQGGILAVPASATWDVPFTSVFAGTLTLDGERELEGLLVDSGTLGGVGSRTVTGLLDLRRGVLTGSATTAVGPGAELRIGAGAGGSLALAGGHVLRIEEGALATWGPTAVEITLEAPGSLVNAGTFEITTDARVRGAGTLVNTGTLTKRSHGLTGIDAPFDNDGTLAVEAGVLDITTDGGLGSDGAITLAERTSLRTFGNVTLGAAASVTGAGDVQVQGGILAVPASATWDVPFTSVFAGTLTLDGERELEGLLVDSGTLGGVGTRTVTGLLDLRRGVLTGSATTAVGPGAELRIGAGAGGSLALAGGHVLRIEEGALATWGPTAVEITLEAPGSLVNAGTFEITTDARVRGAGTLVNTGTLTKRSHGLTGIDAPFDNDGTLAVEAGVLDITTDGGLGSDGAITLAERTSLRTFGNVTLGAAASVTGAGDVQVQGGILAVPASATWDVPFTSVFAGTLTLDGERELEGLLVDSGTLGGVGSRTVTGLLDLRRGVLTGSATTAVGPGAELRIGAGAGGSLALAGGHVLRIEEGALATWGPTAVEITLEAPGSLVNAGTFEITTDARVRGAGTLVNTGTLTKRSHGLTGIDAPFDNDGTLAVEAGVLDMTGEGLDNAGTLIDRGPVLGQLPPRTARRRPGPWRSGSSRR